MVTTATCWAQGEKGNFTAQLIIDAVPDRNPDMVAFNLGLAIEFMPAQDLKNLHGKVLPWATSVTLTSARNKGGSKYTVSAMWNEIWYPVELFLKPAHADEEITIVLANIPLSLTETFDERKLTDYAKKHCKGDPTEFFEMQQQYFLCRGVYTRFRVNGSQDKTGAIQAFSGWFMAAYRMALYENTPFARDRNCEGIAITLERQVARDGNIQSRLPAERMPGDFIKFIAELDAAEQNPAREDEGNPG
jgi:hypothetical protein